MTRVDFFVGVWGGGKEGKGKCDKREKFFLIFNGVKVRFCQENTGFFAFFSWFFLHIFF